MERNIGRIQKGSSVMSRLEDNVGRSKSRVTWIEGSLRRAQRGESFKESLKERDGSGAHVLCTRIIRDGSAACKICPSSCRICTPTGRARQIVRVKKYPTSRAQYTSNDIRRVHGSCSFVGRANDDDTIISYSVARTYIKCLTTSIGTSYSQWARREVIIFPFRTSRYRP